MKRRRRWLFLGLIALLAVGAIALIFRRDHLVYPTPETESAFYQNYSPESVLKSFFAKGENFAHLEGDGGEPGKESAAHWREREDHFFIEPQNWMPLMTSVADDLTAQLAARGAQIQDISGDAREGFRFQYTVGNTFGSAVIDPLVIPDTTIHGRPLYPQDTPARLRIRINEEWFKGKPGLITMKVTADIH